MAIRRSVKKAQTLLYLGEVPSSIYVIESGIVRAMNISDSGDESTIALFTEGDFFPIGTSTSRATVALFYYETVTDCVINLMSKDEFADYLGKNSEAQMDRLSKHLVSSFLHINALNRNRARDRVAYVMQYLSIRFGEPLMGGAFNKIDLQLTQKDIAQLCGLTRETTTVELLKLKEEGAIVVKKKYYSVHNKGIAEILGNQDVKMTELL